MRTIRETIEAVTRMNIESAQFWDSWKQNPVIELKPIGIMKQK